MPIAFGIAPNDPELLVTEQHSFITGLTKAFTAIAALCYTAAAAGIVPISAATVAPSGQ